MGVSALGRTLGRPAAMPRTARSCLGGYTYHVLNRGNAAGDCRSTKPDGSDAFLDLMAEASVRTPMRILAYCLMPNHFHLALWPREDGDVEPLDALADDNARAPLPGALSVQRSCLARTVQGVSRSRKMSILLAVLRYIERNPLRAGLVEPSRRHGRGRACAGSQLRCGFAVSAFVFGC